MRDYYYGSFRSSTDCTARTTECEYEENQFTGNRPRSYLEIYLLYSYFTFIPSITKYSFYTQRLKRLSQYSGKREYMLQNVLKFGQSHELMHHFKVSFNLILKP